MAERVGKIIPVSENLAGFTGFFLMENSSFKAARRPLVLLVVQDDWRVRCFDHQIIPGINMSQS